MADNNYYKGEEEEGRRRDGEGKEGELIKLKNHPEGHLGEFIKSHFIVPFKRNRVPHSLK